MEMEEKFYIVVKTYTGKGYTEENGMEIVGITKDLQMAIALIRGAIIHWRNNKEFTETTKKENRCFKHIFESEDYIVETTIEKNILAEHYIKYDNEIINLNLTEKEIKEFEKI